MFYDIANACDAECDREQNDFGQKSEHPKPCCNQCLCDGAVLSDVVVAATVADFNFVQLSPPQRIIVSSNHPATADVQSVATAADNCCLKVRLLI